MKWHVWGRQQRGPRSTPWALVGEVTAEGRIEAELAVERGQEATPHLRDMTLRTTLIGGLVTGTQDADGATDEDAAGATNEDDE